MHKYSSPWATIIRHNFCLQLQLQFCHDQFCTSGSLYVYPFLWSSSSVTLDEDCYWATNFKPCHRFLIGLVTTPLVLDVESVQCRFGCMPRVLFCRKTPSLKSLADWNRFSSRIAQCLGPSILSSYRTSLPTQPLLMNIMLPPPCFTVEMGWWEVLGFY